MKTLVLAAIGAVALSSPAAARSSIECLRKHELAHAGGWPWNHPGAIVVKGCGTQLNGQPFPMPPPGKYPLRGRKVIWHIGEPMPCGDCQAVTIPIGGDPVHIWLPAVDANGNAARRRRR